MFYINFVIILTVKNTSKEERELYAWPYMFITEIFDLSHVKSDKEAITNYS
jgi:hypothetical protein